MRRNHTIRWLIAGGTGLLFAAGVLWYRQRAHSFLPPVRDYGSLPARFTEALQSARANVRATGDGPEAVRRLARLYQANRLYAEARTCYRMLAATIPGLTARDHYYLADIALNESDLPAAQTELRAVLRSEPRYVPARLALAESLFKSGAEEEAAREYAAILAIDAGQPQASLGQVRIELQRGQEDAAVARLDDLMAGHPELTSAAGLFAQILDRRGETDRAVALAQWSRQKPEPIPPDPWMAELMADCYDLQRLALRFEDYFKTGQIDEAVPFLHRVEELDPASPVPQLLRGWSLSQAHHDEEAVVQYQQALAKGGDAEKICPYLTQALVALKRSNEAGRMLAEYHAKLPASIPILLAYADVVVQQGDVKLARTLLTKVLQAEPYLYAPNMNLAKILWTNGERTEAARCLQRIATVNSADVPSRALLGEYYLGRSDPRSALRPLTEALAQAKQPTPVHRSLLAMLDDAYLQCGTLEVKSGHWTEANDFFEKAVQLAPTDPRAYANKANVAMQLKQFRAAAGALGKMAALQPENPTILLSLGDVIYQDGQPDQARVHWQKALQLAAADDTELRNALAARLAGHITAETFQ